MTAKQITSTKSRMRCRSRSRSYVQCRLQPSFFHVVDHTIYSREYTQITTLKQNYEQRKQNAMPWSMIDASMIAASVATINLSWRHLQFLNFTTGVSMTEAIWGSS